TGTTSFGGEVGVGANNALAKLILDAGGSTAINTDQITTTGDQDYRDAVTLGAKMGAMNLDTTLTSTMGTVKFSTANSTVDGAAADNDGAHGLAIMGNAALSAAAGGKTKLGFLNTAMGGAVSLVNVTTTGQQDYAATTSITLNGTYTTSNNPFTVENVAILAGA